MRRIVVATVTTCLLTLIGGPAFAQSDGGEPVEEPFRGSLSVDMFQFTGGDGDGVPEPGERLEVELRLFNGSRDTVRDISGTVESATDDVTVVEGSSTWPDLGVEDYAANRDPIVIQIAGDATPQDVTCEPLPRGEPVDGDEPISSDGGTVSSDGVVVPDEPAPPDGAEPGSEPGSAGGGEPGSTGADDPAVIEPMPAEDAPTEEQIAEEQKLEAGQTEETPVEETTVEPEPMPVEPQPAPGEEATPPVHVSLALQVTSSAGDEQLFADNGIFCAYTDVGAPEPGVPATDEDKAYEAIPIAGRAGQSDGAGRATAIVTAAIILAALGATLGAQWMRSRATT